MRYFIGRDGRQLGPFTEQQVREQLAAGLVAPGDLFWYEGKPDWQPLHTHFSGPASPSLPPPLPSAHASLRPGPPALPSGAGHHPTTPLKLASREVRLLATSLDHLAAIAFAAPGLVRFVSALIGPLQAMLLQIDTPPDGARLLAAIHPALRSSWPLLALPLVFLAALQTVLLCRRGQTVGKLLCKIRVVRIDGTPAGFVHAFLLRAVSMGFITAIPLVGWMVSSIDPLLIFRGDRRCLHDLIAGTTVIDR